MTKLNVEHLKKQLIELHANTCQDLTECYAFESWVKAMSDSETLSQAVDAGLID